MLNKPTTNIGRLLSSLVLTWYANWYTSIYINLTLCFCKYSILKQFSQKRFNCNCYFFQKIAIYNEGRQKMTMSAEYKLSKYKKTINPLVLFHGSQMHLYPFVYFHFHAKDLLKLNTLVTKYTGILIFNFAHTICPQQCIMPL